MLLIVGIWFMLIAAKPGGGGRVMNSAKAVPVVMTKTILRLLLKIMAGADEAKQELKKLSSSGIRRNNDLGAKMPKGVLLCRPPGTGKTLLARLWLVKLAYRFRYFRFRFRRNVVGNGHFRVQIV